jgi:hypothetical protein
MDTTSQTQLNQQMAMMHGMLPMFFFFGLLWIIVLVVPFWMIFKKAGFAGALSLLMIIPLVNLIMLYVLAFSRWKTVPAQDVYVLPQD